MVHAPCAYCGSERIERTKGHVLPRSLYPSTVPNAKRITVPECLECKKLWEDAEPQFRNIILSIWNSEALPSDDRADRMLRSFKQPDGKRRARELLATFAPGHVGSHDLIYPAKDPGFNLILRRIVRGLCHEHQLATFVQDDEVLCDVMRWQVPPAFEEALTWYTIGADFFRYAYAAVNEESIHSFWLLHFSKHIVFFGVVEQ